MSICSLFLGNRLGILSITHKCCRADFGTQFDVGQS